MAEVELPPVMENFVVGDIEPQKDMDLLVGIGEVTLDEKDKFQVFVFQNQKGQKAAKLDNKFDLSYLDKVKEARGKEISEDAEGLIAAMQKLADTKPKIEAKVIEKWDEIAKDLDFKPGGKPKLEGELAEKWDEKEKAMAARDAELNRS